MTSAAPVLSRRPHRETPPPSRLQEHPATWWRNSVDFAPGESIAHDATGLCFVLRGWVTRSRLLPDGRRQTLELLLPGDHHGPAGVAGSEDDVLNALGACRVAHVPVTAVHEGPEPVRAAVAAAELRRCAIMEERVVSLGRRTAPQRMAHFFCELLTRMGGPQSAGRCEFRLRQGELADVLGLSVVHTNRTVQQLRRTRLAEISRGELRVPDVASLAAFAGFSPEYLA